MHRNTTVTRPQDADDYKYLGLIVKSIQCTYYGGQDKPRPCQQVAQILHRCERRHVWRETLVKTNNKTRIEQKKHDHRAHVMISCNGFVAKGYPFALGFRELQSDSQLKQRVAAEQGADETTVVLQRLVYLSSRNFITVAGCKLLVATLQHRHCAQQDSLQLHTHVINDTILCHKSTGEL